MAAKKYPAEIKERAVRLVLEARKIDPSDRSAISRIARQLGVGGDSLRAWVKQVEIDAGNKPGVTTEESARVKALEAENRELRRSNEILKLASAFSRGSSTRKHRRNSSLHRHPSWGVRRRADLQNLAVRVEHLLRGQETQTFSSRPA